MHLRNFYTRTVDVSFQPMLKGFLPLCHLRYLLLRWNLRKKRKKIPPELWFMECEQDPTLMEEKLIEGGGTYICKCYCNSKLAEKGWTVLHLIWADFLKHFLNTSFFSWEWSCTLHYDGRKVTSYAKLLLAFENIIFD